MTEQDINDQTPFTQQSGQTRKAQATNERARIERAMAQLLARLRTDAISWPTVSELARVAGVNRWVLTHKHVDLKERFQAAVADLKSAGVSLPAAPSAASALQTLQQEVTRLRRENAELRGQIAFYANTLHGISLAYQALAIQRDSVSNVVTLPVPLPEIPQG